MSKYILLSLLFCVYLCSSQGKNCEVFYNSIPLFAIDENTEMEISLMSGFNDHIEIYYNRKEIVSKYFRENKVTGYTTSIKLKKKSFKKPNELVVLLKKNRQKLVVNLNNNYNFLRIFYSNKKWTLHYDNEDVVLEQ